MKEVVSRGSGIDGVISQELGGCADRVVTGVDAGAQTEGAEKTGVRVSQEV